MNINIRFAETSDAHAIAVVHVASWQKIYEGKIPAKMLNTLSITERERQWFDLLSQEVKILLIERDNRIVGFASLCAARDLVFAASLTGEISALYLYPCVWRQGLGTKLCSAAISELKNKGFSEVILWVLNSNQQARKFYSSMGFVENGQTKMEVYVENIILEEICYSKKL